MSDGSQATPPSAPPEAGWRLSAYAVAVIVAVVAAKLGGFVAANDYEASLLCERTGRSSAS